MDSEPDYHVEERIVLNPSCVAVLCTQCFFEICLEIRKSDEYLHWYMAYERDQAMEVLLSQGKESLLFSVMEQKLTYRSNYESASVLLIERIASIINSRRSGFDNDPSLN